MSRKAERESEILREVQSGLCKDDLMTKLVGGCTNPSVIKSFYRAYRNLLKKRSITEEPRTILKRYKITVLTWVNRSQKSENTISGNG